MKICHNIYIACFALILSVIIFCCSLFHYGLSKVSNNNIEKEVVIEPGTIESIATTLYQENLIKNKLAFKIYVQITGKKNLKAATYYLSENMGTPKIVEILEEGKGEDSSKISITFKEGINIRKIAKIISDNTDYQETDVYSVLKNQDYLRTLINKYWFLSDEILNQEIYYSLEGYLYPNTYYFSKENANIEEILEKMLEETNRQLSPYKDQMLNNSNSIHEIITLASIVELEGITLNDRKGIAGVFINRLNTGMNLGSDVTTYYGAKIDIGERDLLKEEINECNQYNTRCSNFTTLPISPICNPSIEAILAAIEPETNDYYYFVADKNKKIYFSKNITEHNSIIQELKKKDLWYEY